MFDTIKKIVAGALIPSFATIVFNMMNHFFENYDKTPIPKVSDSAFDVGMGCAFSLIGICVTARTQTTSSKFLLVFVLLLLTLISAQMLAPIFLQWPKFYTIWVGNIFAVLALSWAIVEAG